MKHSYIVMKVNIGLHKKGDQILIEVDDSGIPLDPYWRKRLKDSKIDNSCEIIHDKKDLPERKKDLRKTPTSPVVIPPKRSVSNKKPKKQITPKPRRIEE